MGTYILLVVGLNILLINNAESYVMLTANFSDLKRIASKFLPRTLVDSVAGIFDDALKPFGATTLKESGITADIAPEDISIENLKYEDKYRKTKETSRYSNNFKKPLRIAENDKDQLIESEEPIPKRDTWKYKFPKKVSKHNIYPEKLRDDAKSTAKESKSVETSKGEGMEISDVRDSGEEAETTVKANNEFTPQNDSKESTNLSDRNEENIKPSNEDSNINYSKESTFNRETRDSRENIQSSFDATDENDHVDNEFLPIDERPIGYFDPSFRRMSLTTPREKNEFDQYFTYLPKFDYSRL